MLANEEQLAKRAAERDPLTFAELYDYYVEKIYRYIYHKCGCADEAEDLTAQVFLKAWEAIGNYRWEGYPFSAWLYRIAHNKIIDYYRTHRKTLPLDIARTFESENDPVDAAERALTSGQIQSALEKLTWDQQVVIILRFIEGYSTAEVAVIMDKRPETIRIIHRRALRALQPWVASENAHLPQVAGSV